MQAREAFKALSDSERLCLLRLAPDRGSDDTDNQSDPNQIPSGGGGG